MRPVVLAKGLGQGTGTEEFRVVLPTNPTGEISSRLSASKTWGEFLHLLYDRTAEDLSRQYAILLALHEFAVFCVAPAKDPFGRRSVVIVGLVADRTRTLDAQIAAEALGRIRKGISDIANTIKDGSRERLQQVTTRITSGPPPKSEPGESDFFRDLLATRAYAGAATPLLLWLGADVVIGTPHEARRAEITGLRVRGYLDIPSGRLVSLSPAELEVAQPPKSAPANRKTMKTKELLEEIIGRLDAIEEDLRDLKRLGAMEEDLRDLRSDQAVLLKEVSKKGWF